MQYKVNDIVEIINMKDFSDGDRQHWISRNKSYDVKENYVGQRFRVSSIDKDGTLYFDGGGCAATSIVMLYSRKTDNTQ